MTIRVAIALELDPNSLDHKAWFSRVREVLATAPDGATFEMKKPYALREVNVDELLEHLITSGHHSYHMRGDAERLWGMLVRLCGKKLDVAVPSEREATKRFPLPLEVLKKVTLGHFEGTSTKTDTRRKLLAFIEGLH